MKKRLTSFIILCLVFVLGAPSVSAFTPPGLDKKGGLPPGIQKKFNEDEKHTKENYVVVKDIDVEKRRIVIEDGTAIISLLVSDKAKIELNKKSAKLQDIRKNDKVYVKLDKNNTIIELKATREKETVYTVQGKLLLVNKAQNQVYIYENNVLVNYELESDVVVRINGNKRSINDLISGMDVKLTIEGNKVTLIEAKSLGKESQKGIVKSINIDKREIILTQGSKEILYKINSNVVVKINGIYKELKDITVNMEAELIIQNGQVIEINVNQSIQSFQGRIIAKDVSSKPSITIQIGNDIKVFAVKKELNIVGVEVGREAVINVKDGEVISIVLK